MKQVKEFNWGPATFLITYQLFFLASFPVYLYYSSPGIGLIALSVLLFFLTGIAITGGYHRLYSHKAYKTNSFIEGIILFFATMSAQGSALRWSFDHRIHHAYVDTDEDPYSIKKGFWYAHFLWILEKPRKIDQKVVPDLLKNPLVMFQHNYYPLWMVLTNLLSFLFAGWLFGDFLGAFFVSLLARMFCLHHSTWFINSLAHTWGEKPFCQEQTAVDNYVLALLTFGEGYHNYHHTFANDYRNGIKWYHYDPTKWTIWFLEKLGMAKNLRKMDQLTIKKRMVLECKTQLEDKIRSLIYVKSEELQKAVEEISERILKELSDFIQLKERYRQLRRGKEGKEIVKSIQRELKEVKHKLREDWKQFSRLSRHIMALEPLSI